MGTTVTRQDLQRLTEGLNAHRNLSTAQLVETAIARGEGRLAANGALVAMTGARTGRSPRDKFTVEDDQTRQRVHWGKVNQPFPQDKFDALLERVLRHMAERDLYVMDLAAGADPAYRLPIEVICEYAWHALFVKQLFVRPTAEELESHAPEFTVIAAPEFEGNPERDGVRSATFILADFTKKIVLIGGTKYAGEMKKSIFGVMNYLLPERNVFPMHCSANIGADGATALFFGLSGTGKTTLSDRRRRARMESGRRLQL
jgi:phosphoenolpyruvate carboxykinase (ATP)